MFEADTIRMESMSTEYNSMFIASIKRNISSSFNAMAKAYSIFVVKHAACTFVSIVHGTDMRMASSINELFGGEKHGMKYSKSELFRK